MSHALAAELAARIEALVPQLEGWCSIEKALAMAACICEYRPRCCVEIGVLGGRSLAPQALALQYLGEGRIFGIDPWQTSFSLQGDQDPGNSEFWGRVDHERLYRQCVRAIASAGLFEVCTLLRAPAERCTELFDRIDLLHIDGNHDAEIAWRDVQSYLPKVPPGGHVWFDDADWKSTQKALAALQEQCVVVKHFGTHVWFRKRVAGPQPKSDGVRNPIVVREAAGSAAQEAFPPVRRIVLAADDRRCGNYRGGVYNPGAVRLDERLVILARNECYSELERQRNPALWPDSCRPLVVYLDREGRIEATQPLALDDSLRGERAEDFRLFFHAGRLHASFTRVIDPGRIEQQVSSVNLEAGRLERPRRPLLDFAPRPIEKNWCFFEWGDELHLLYSFQPFRLLKLTDAKAFRFETVLHCELTTVAEEPGWRGAPFASLSAAPVEFDEHRWLLFVHWRDPAGNYRQYGVLLDRESLRPLSIARQPIFAGGAAQGLHPHVLYLMSVVRTGDEFDLFLGEGDEHVSQSRLTLAALRSYLDDSAAIASRTLHQRQVTGAYHYEHCGLFGRRVGLAADGAVLQGAEHDSHWRLEGTGDETELWLLGSGRLSCRLRPTADGDWEGRWNWGAPPVVRLTRLPA